MSLSNDNSQQNSQQSQNTNSSQTNSNQQDAPRPVPLFLPFTFIFNGPQNNPNSTSPPPTSLPQSINIQIPTATTNPTNNDQTTNIPPLPNGTTPPFIHFFFYPMGEGEAPNGMMFFTPFFMTTPEVQKPRASEQAMKKLPIVKITKKHIDAQANCPICLDLFQMPGGKENIDSKCALAREMPCKHQFCESCLFEWLRQSNTCPLCRKEIEPEVLQAQENSNQQTASVPTSGNDEANHVRMQRSNNNNGGNTIRQQQQQSRGARHSPYTHRNANGRRQTSCALDRVGCCGESNNSNANETPSPILTLSQCHHRFHSSCLRTSLLVEGYSLDIPNLSFRCPTCRAPAQLRNEELKVSGRIADNSGVRNEREESEGSTSNDATISLPITIRLTDDTEQNSSEMDLD